MLAFNETPYRTLVEEAAEGICQADAQGIIRFANRRAVELFGASAVDALVGRSSLEILVESERAIGRDMIKRRARGLSDRYEIAFLRSDGSIGSARLSATPLFENGVFAGSFSVISPCRADLDPIEGKRPRCFEVRRDRWIVAICKTGGDSLILSVDHEDRAFWGQLKLQPGASLRDFVRDDDLNRYDRAFARAVSGASCHSTMLARAGTGKAREPALWSFSPSTEGDCGHGASVLISEVTSSPPLPRFPDASIYDGFALTVRERDVADLLLMGLEYKGIARCLCISLPTVQTHVAKVYGKMGVHSIDDLVDLIYRM